jgi:hypothetical protein
MAQNEPPLTYPSINGPTFAFLGAPCLAFEKYDGSNLRFFWDQRRGWHSSGTRYRWFKPAKTRTWLEELGRRAGESESLRAEFELNVREQQLPPEAVAEPDLDEPG